MAPELWTKFSKAEIELAYNLARLRLSLRAARLAACLKAGFRPGQPRVPAGNPDGGQWTHVPGWAGRGSAGSGGSSNAVGPFRGLVVLVGRRSRWARGGMVRVGSRWLPATPAQQVRLQLSLNASRKATRDVLKIDPNWRPHPQAYETVEGFISANRAIETQAKYRIRELTGTRSIWGEFAVEWIPAPLTNRRLNRREQAKINRLGRECGCHWCGSKEPKTKSGNFIGDHLPARSMGKPSRIAPHCLFCSNSQGGVISRHKSRNKR